MQLSQGPFSYNRFDAVDAAYKALYEKKAAKDYDGDGKVESGKEEYFGSRDKAIKKAMGKEVKEGAIEYPKGPKQKFTKDKSDPKVAAGRKAAKEMGLKMNEGKGELPDFIKKKMDDKKEGKKGKCECTKEDFTNFLIHNGYCNNVVSAEVMMNHMSNDFWNYVVETVEEGYMPMTPERKAKVEKQKQGAFQKDHAARAAGKMGEADKQFKRRMAMDSMTKMKR